MYEKLTKEAAEILEERFGKDNVIALATISAEHFPYGQLPSRSKNDSIVTCIPCVRSVNAYYEDGAFYIITHALSNKMKQLANNPVAAIAGEWFTAHGTAVNLGYFYKEENAPIAAKLKIAFAEWITNGHNNFEDENTIILCIRLTDGVLYSHGTRYDIDFTC